MDPTQPNAWVNPTHGQLCVVCCCIAYDACSVWGRCDQLCSVIADPAVNPASAAADTVADGVRCSCVPGYHLMHDQHTCAADGG